MHKHTSKSKLKVDGKMSEMSEQGADRAGLIQSLALLILAIGISIALIIWAVN
ncbi:hypothetical protein KPC_2910 [Acinetobacter stercoris]|uniref:Uncharacterized protein n=1 Tax=Acinetobacter stercoris TaxID=2126983 RepID=A0A2U3N248_9GAMM|nr:hypothetical protein KPC_2910 [Acinetobacter stercoris]